MGKRPSKNEIVTTTGQSNAYEDSIIRMSRCNLDVHGVSILADVKRLTTFETSGSPTGELLAEILYLPVVKKDARRP